METINENLFDSISVLLQGTIDFMKRKQFIELPNPCHENWSDMEKVTLGRYCNVCEKKVVDFTRMSDQQVIEILESSNFKTCGKFTKHQLNNGFEKKKENFLPFRIKAAASAVFLLFSTKSFALNTPKTEKVEIITKSISPQVYSFRKQINQVPIDTNKRYLKGVVLDSITGDTFPGAKLFIKGSEAIRTMSDLDGKFILEIPISLIVDSFVLVVHAVSFRMTDFEMSLSLKDDLDNIKVLLSSDIRDIQSVPMIGLVVPAKKKWWKQKNRKFNKN